jgi:hypothetical protein
MREAKSVALSADGSVLAVGVMPRSMSRGYVGVQALQDEWLQQGSLSGRRWGDWRKCRRVPNLSNSPCHRWRAALQPSENGII